MNEIAGMLETATGLVKDMLAENYHELSPYIGSSTLIAMNKSPKHFKHAWETPCEPTPAMAKGTLIHSLLLEQDVSCYVARPLNEKGELVRSNSKEYAAFLEANPGKTPIHPDDHQSLYTMLNSFCENGRAMAMLKDARIEHSVFAKDPETGLLLKARPDILGNGFIADLKSTADVSRFERQVFQSMYDVRLAHYAKTLEYATGEVIDEFYFIAYESCAPYCSKVFQMHTTDMQHAKDKWRQLINQISVCTKTDSWPGYSDSICFVEKPRFLESNVTLDFEEVV